MNSIICVASGYFLGIGIQEHNVGMMLIAGFILFSAIIKSCDNDKKNN